MVERLRKVVFGVAFCCASTCLAADWGGLLELATDYDDGDVNVVRLGLQKSWDSTWFESDMGHLSGFWKFGVGYWDGDDANTDDDELFELFATPVFQYRFSRFNAYLEAGVGAHLLSETKIADYDLSSTFQFGSHFGVGLLFGEHQQLDLSYRLQHLSNGGIEEPNDGIDLHVLHVGYRF